MVRRNRKLKQHGTVLPVPFGGLVVFLSALAIGYVWLDCRCEAVGNEIKELEKQRAELQKVYLNEQCRWVQLRTPAAIEKALQSHGIDMDLPKPNQVVALRDTSVLDGLDRPRLAAVDAGGDGVVMNE